MLAAVSSTATTIPYKAQYVHPTVNPSAGSKKRLWRGMEGGGGAAGKASSAIVSSISLVHLIVQGDSRQHSRCESDESPRVWEEGAHLSDCKSSGSAPVGPSG